MTSIVFKSRPENFKNTTPKIFHNELLTHPSSLCVIPYLTEACWMNLDWTHFQKGLLFTFQKKLFLWLGWIFAGVSHFKIMALDIIHSKTSFHNQLKKQNLPYINKHSTLSRLNKVSYQFYKEFLHTLLYFCFIFVDFFCFCFIFIHSTKTKTFCKIMFSVNSLANFSFHA